MDMFMDIKHVDSLDQLRAFVKGGRQFTFKAKSIEDRYEIIERIVDKFDYPRLSKKEKHIVLAVLKIFTGYKKSQLHQLIDLSLAGKLSRKKYIRINIHHTYTGYDIELLEKTDELHYRLSAAATHEIMRREYEIFKKKEYENISHISFSHINNLRESDRYKAKYLHHTQARQISIGETAKPNPNNIPGSIRVDTVSQSNVFHINSIDEITQWEAVVCVPQISEFYLLPALQSMLDQYPFIIFNFHSDRGSEFINRIVAHLLNKLLIHQTKSRSRHCNDNALVEGKNGSVIRKNLGFFHVNQSLVNKFNNFFKTWFNLYLNYHRPCGFVTEVITDFKGREKKIYGQYTTPFEKLKEISKEQNKNFLKPGISFEKLDGIAYNMSDNEFTALMRKHQYELFDINSLLKSR
jgi:hypothetical protein